MNYRHAFHAGNFADVHKHVVLLALIERLLRKPKPLLFLDTHAGRGWYDLRSEAATRSLEWRDGIARLAGHEASSEDLRRYLTAVSAAGASPEGSGRYPGSPILALRQLRDNDRIVLVERQLEEAHALELATRGRRGVSVVCGDGYAAVKTYLPPRENRGLVLLDPPYESDQEFTTVRQALQTGLARWPNGVFALWYPIKASAEVSRLHAALQGSGMRKLLRLELTVRPSDSPLGLNGSGLIIANPPWRLDDELRPALDELHRVLAPQPQGMGMGARAGGSRVDWLAPE